MRFAVGGIFNETNTFAAPVTDIAAFTIRRGADCLGLAGANHSLGGAIDACREFGIDPVPILYADSLATGTTARPVFEALLEDLAAGIAVAGRLDGVMLALHGAMVAGGHPDADAAIVRRVREVVGPDVPIAVAIDFHANIGQPMIDAADIVTVYDTYPHCDQAERTREAVALLARTARREIRPVTALVKPPMMPVPQGQHTARPPFSDLIARAHEIEERGDALVVSVAGGFAYADVAEAGLSVLVTTDGDAARARTLAASLAREAWDAREAMSVRNAPVAEAVAEAIAFPGGPVMLVDVGDNIGGGTPGDGTTLLAELLRQGARGAVMVIADREAVAAAVRAGEGGTLETAVGGKTDRWHGDPVPIRGRVRSITDGRWVHEGPEWAGVPVEMGTTAVVEVDGLTLVLTGRATAPGDLQQLKSLAIDPLAQHIIVVKAAVRWRGGYGPIAAHAIHVDTPGLGSADLSRFPYRHIRRPIWPLDPAVEWPRQA
ncbi:MAG: M81 family metallopeptidase [Chloroflexota bacterium]